MNFTFIHLFFKDPVMVFLCFLPPLCSSPRTLPSFFLHSTLPSYALSLPPSLLLVYTYVQLCSLVAVCLEANVWHWGIFLNLLSTLFWDIHRLWRMLCYLDRLSSKFLGSVSIIYLCPTIPNLYVCVENNTCSHACAVGIWPNKPSPQSQWWFLKSGLTGIYFHQFRKHHDRTGFGSRKLDFSTALCH